MYGFRHRAVKRVAAHTVKGKKNIMAAVFFALALSLTAACGSSDAGKISFQEGTYYSADAADKGMEATQTDAGESVADAQEEDAIFMVMENDLQNHQITLLNLNDGRQICYEYTDGTEFFDKYGEYTPGRDFAAGRLAVIKRLNSNDTLGALAFTDRTWDYENIRNYSIDMERNVISIADTAYRCDGNLKVFSEGEEVNLYDIGKEDVLTVCGVGRTVCSIVIEAGHGVLALTNTELFEGGWLNLGTKVYATIEKDMQMEVPEGVYEFSVANDGYGDSGEILIRRNRTTTIDLNDYKGEGPKLCSVTFNVGVEKATIMIDGKKINYKKPQELKYGVYELSVIAEGYEPWSKKLVIKAPEAVIDIALDEASEESSSQEASGAGTDNSADAGQSGSADAAAGSKAGSLAGSHTGGQSSSGSSGASSSGNASDSALANTALDSSIANVLTGGDSTDYLDTLADLIDSLDSLDKYKKQASENTEEDSGSGD